MNIFPQGLEATPHQRTDEDRGISAGAARAGIGRWKRLSCLVRSANRVCA